MIERNIKAYFKNVGKGIGAYVMVSVPLLKKMGITQDSREIKVIYDEEKQTITIIKRKLEETNE